MKTFILFTILLSNYSVRDYSESLRPLPQPYLCFLFMEIVGELVDFGTITMRGGRNYRHCILVDSKNIALFPLVLLTQTFLFFYAESNWDFFLLIIRHLNIFILLLEVMDDWKGCKVSIFWGLLYCWGIK